MKTFMQVRAWFPVLVLAVLASGCASISPYAISEGEIERHLKRAVADYDRQHLQSGSPLSLSLSDADITLGPDGRDVAVIDLRGQVALNALMAKLPVDLALKDNVMRVVAQMLETMPVYRLNEEDFAQRMLGIVPVDIRVAPGRLEFVTADR